MFRIIQWKATTILKNKGDSHDSQSAAQQQTGKGL